MKNLPLLIGSLVVTFLAVIGVSVLFTNKATAPTKPVDTQLLISDSPHVRGKTDAKVTFVEFSDFQCPACKAAQPLVDSVLKQGGDSIRFVYRHFPLRSIHIHAAQAARAAEAAQKQGKFWEFHDKLFATQEVWAAQSDPSAKFLEYAKDLGLNVDQFKKDIEDASLDARITSDERDGNVIGVAATPTFYINGVKTDASALSEAVTSVLTSK